MKAYNIGDCIRQLREEQNVNQEDLCRGLCSKSTLSRIERGCHVPSMGTVALLLQRLGVNEDSLSFLLGTAEMEISNLHKEIEALNAQRKYDEALQKIGQMEQLTDPKDRVMQQFLLRSKALAGHLQDGQRVAYDNLAKREMLLQAIELTHPSFSLDNIGRCLLGIDEIKTINQIAITYSDAGDRRYAIHIYRQLFEYPRSRFYNTEAEVSVLTMLAYNYSTLLGRERRYEECIEYAQMGYEACIKYNKARMLGGLLLNWGYALQKLGQEEESKSKIKDSYHAYRLMQRFPEAENVKKYAKETFNLDLAD